MATDLFGILGTTVAGAFRVEAVVAEGGFAVVYRAYHEGFRAPVALKCLKIPQHMSREAQARFEMQFAAEAELLFKLSAAIPVVVRPLHVEVVPAPDGTFMPFLALEWLEGETLAAVAERRAREGRPRFSLNELLPALAPVARALERAHHWDGSDGPVAIVHRDMKPENIFVARVAGEKVVKILDFGIAKAMSVASQVVERTSSATMDPFTPAYAAPEQWMPKRFGKTGPWTDVWGFALTLVELLAGHPILDGDNAAMMGTAIDPMRRPTPRTEGAVIGDSVEAVFLKALAVDPAARYRDVGQFWRELVEAYNADKRADVAPPSAARPAASMSLLPTGGLGRHNLIPDLEPEPRVSKAPREDRLVASGAHSLELATPLEHAPPRITESTALPPVHELAPSKPPPSHRPPSTPRPPPPTFEPRTQAAELASRFAVPAGMLLAGILITVVDGIYAASEGRVFSVGPLRPGWFAGALVLGGILVALVRFLKSEP